MNKAFLKIVPFVFIMEADSLNLCNTETTSSVKKINKNKPRKYVHKDGFGKLKLINNHPVYGELIVYADKEKNLDKKMQRLIYLNNEIAGYNKNLS